MSAEFEFVEIENEDCPVKTTVHSFDGLSLEAPISVVVSHFSDTLRIIITEAGSTGVLYKVSLTRGRANLETGEIRHIFDSVCVFGHETEESLVAARLIAEKVNCDIPILIGFGFRDLEALTTAKIRGLVDFVAEKMSVIFGQIVIGSPGAGKTTYCEAMARFLKAIGRDVAIVNIDPANESVPYTADIDVSELIKLEEVMDHYKLGPNGGLVYCMEYLEKNMEWLLTKLASVKKKYLLIDCPGQVELYTHNDSVRSIITQLEAFGARLCAVNLVDAHYCSDPAKYVAVCLTSLNTMLRIELPHINILSKVDLIEKYGKLDFGIDFYTEVLDLEYLIDRMPDDPFIEKHKKLTKAITGLVQDYGLVNFIPLSVDSKELMIGVKNAVDKANGYCFGSTAEERNIQAMMSSAFGASDFEYAKTREIRENFMDEENEGAEITNDLDKIDKEPGFQV